MARLWFGNFDFEARLAGVGGPSSTAICRLAAELSLVWCAVADEGDVVWCDETVERGFCDEMASRGLPQLRVVSDRTEITDSLVLEPWGWCAGLPQQANIRSEHPAFDVVKRVNARDFSSDLETKIGCGLVRAARVASLEDLHAAVERVEGAQRWVIKAQYSNSARERCLGQGSTLGQSVVDWCRKRLQRDGVVFFEPWVERVDEVGLQFEVPREGNPQLVGVVPLLNNDAGQYVGSRIVVAESSEAILLETAWAEAIAVGRRVAERAQDAGYFGPLGIDAMQYLDRTGRERLRAIQDVNARWTMGRIALGFRRILTADERAVWLHVRWNAPDPASWCRSVEQALPAGTRILRTSPLEMGGKPVEHGTVLLVSRNANDLTVAEELATST